MTTTPTVTVVPREASGPGALDAYAIVCSEHGEVYASSLPMLARLGAQGHRDWHAAYGDSRTY